MIKAIKELRRVTAVFLAVAMFVTGFDYSVVNAAENPIDEVLDSDDITEECLHESLAYVSNDDGTHTVSCQGENCAYTDTEDCDITEDGVCSKCGYMLETDGQGAIGDDDIMLLSLEAPAGSDGISLELNGEALSKGVSKTIGYGDSVTFSLSGTDKTINYYWLESDKDPSDAQWNQFDNGSNMTLSLGSYYIGFEAEDENAGISDYDGDYLISIGKAKIADVTDIVWSTDENSFNVHYTCPTKTKGDYTLPDGKIKSDRHIKLYKITDGAKELVSEFYNPTNSFDFSGTIRSNGFGEYVCSVTLLSNDNDILDDSDECLSESFVYEDKSQPTITEFSYGYDSETKTASLSAKAKDDEYGMGIYKYAFTTETSVDNVVWTAIDADKIKTKNDIVSLSKDISEGGKYYLYVQDGNGNITRSDMPTYGCSTQCINVTKITKYNTYKNGVLQSPVIDYYEGAGVIPVSNPVRKGYEFTGWHVESQEGDLLEDPATGSHTIDSSNQYFATSLNLYAGWSNDNISVSFTATDTTTSSTATTKLYDKSPIKLEASVTGITPEADVVSFEYQWYKKAENSECEAIDGATNGILNVTNVEESGEYIVKLILKVTGEDDVIRESLPQTISIAPIPVTISAKEISICYGNDVPSSFESSQFNYEGLIDGDISSIKTIGSVECVAADDMPAYEKGSDVGTYVIKPTGFTSSNYSIVYEANNNLKVLPKNVESADSGVDAVLSENTFVYSGSANHPGVSVTDSAINGAENPKTLVEGTDYTLSYSPDTTNVTDSAKTIITFKGNYIGTIEKTFSITQDSYTISSLTINNWKYGSYSDAINKPVVVPSAGSQGQTSVSIPDSKIHYYFRKKTGENTYSEWKQATMSEASRYDAGEYQLYVSIDAMENYAAVDNHDTPVSFSIFKRVLILKSEGGEWVYDGNAHYNHSVTFAPSATVDGISYTADGFAYDDTYATLSTNNSQTTVGSITNTIGITFTSSTNAENYQIIKDEGTLTVTAQPLIAPANRVWSSAHPGMATWVAVSRSGLSVDYRVYLYRSNGTQISSGSEGGYFTTQDSAYDFSSIIRDDSKTNGITGYYFKVQAIPVESANKDNYSDGPVSDASSSLFTAKINILKNSDEVESATIGEDDSTTKYVIAGESDAINVTYKQGYKENSVVWTVSSADDSSLTGIVIGNNTKPSTTLMVKAGITKAAEYNVTANAQDEEPVALWSFDSDYAGRYKENMTKAILSLQMQDTLSLASYCVAKFDSAAAFESGRTAIEGDGSKWTSITDQTAIAGGYSYATSYEINTPGFYYLGVKDTKGQIVWTDPCIVYQINFDKGVGTGGSMDSILKVHGYDITSLPANGFTKEGYAFTEWSQSELKKVFMNQGMYADNRSATLVAKWSNEIYTFTVNYYLMNTNGEYDSGASSSEEHDAIIGTHIVASDSLVAKEMTGFSLDTEHEDIHSEITISSPDQEMNIYYKRNEYSIKYLYTDIDGTQKYVKDSQGNDYEERYLYGADINSDTAAAHKVEIGYTFVGWLYDGVEKRPATMPGHDLVAQGSFAPGDAQYKVHYFVRNLNDDGYVELDTELETRTSIQGTNITFSTAADTEFAKKLDGFTILKVAAVSGNGTPDEEHASSSVTGMVSADASKELNVYYFYTRNTYRLYLNVYKGTRDNASNKLYDAYWVYKYEENLSEVAGKIQSYFENHVKGSVDDGMDAPSKVVTAYDDRSLEGYVLASYYDWSTGPAPSAMPAGDVTISRDYIQDVTQEYKINVYFQNGNGIYDKTAELSYYAPAGMTVELKTTEDPKDDFFNPYTSQFDYLVNGFKYYQLNENPTLPEGSSLPESKLSGVVIKPTEENGHAYLTLNAYFDRKSYTATIYYFYNTESTSTSDTAHYIGQETVTGIWGSNITTVSGTPAKISGFNPVSKFNDTCKEDADRSDSIESYKNENCMISYTASWTINGDSSWRGYEFQTVESLSNGEYATTSSNSVLMGQNDTTKVYVFYTPVNREKTFGVNILTDPYGDDPATNVMYTSNGSDGLTSGTPYTFRLVNKSQIYSATPTQIGTFEDYPALAYMDSNYSFTYGDDPKSEYSEITALEKEGDKYKYFIRTDEPSVILIVNEENKEPFYAGKRYSVNAIDSIPHGVVKDYVTNFNNSNQTQIRLYNQSAFGLNVPDIDGNINNGTLTYTYISLNNYYIYHHALSNECTGHHVVQGGGKTLEELKALEENCDFVKGMKAKRPGYDLTFYKNANGTGDIEAITNMSGNVHYHGIFTKTTIPYNKYIYYELPDYLDDVAYLNEAYISDGGAGSTSATATVNGQSYSLVREETDGESYTISDGMGNTKSITPKIVTYKYNDNIVLIKESHFCYSFQTVNIAYSNYETSQFKFDDTQSANALNGYIEDQALTLRAYYARKTHTLSIKDKTNPSKPDEEVTALYRNGQTVSVADPVRNGYSFDGWTFKDKDGATVSITPSATEDGLGKKFTMPNDDLWMEANWVVAPVKIPVYEYFQTNQKRYLDSKLSEALSPGTVKTSGSIQFAREESTVSGNIYRLDGSLVCVSINDGGYEYFYQATQEGEVVSSDRADIFAAYRELTVNSEEELNFADYIISNDDFAFSNAVCKTDSNVISQSDNAQFNAEYGMALNYYYTRTHRFDLKTAVRSSDNGAISASVAVSGYDNASLSALGDTVTLTQSVAAGFDFVGWYNALEVLEGYDGTSDMSGYSLKADISGATNLSSLHVYPFRMYDNARIVAVYEPHGIPADTVVKISTEQDTYTYGYDSVKNIHVAVTFPEGTDHAVYVKSYKWVKCDSAGNIIDETSLGGYSDYKFEGGLDKGVYYYKCIVEAARKDTERSRLFSSDVQAIHIDPVEIHTKALPFEGTYDGLNHGITVQLDIEQYPYLSSLKGADYTIYYSTVPLTSDNYTTVGTTTPIQYKDVKVNASGDVESYNVYYYVQPGEAISNNYLADSGVSTVTINPKRLSIAKNEAFSKVFDNSDTVAGALSVSSSDKYRLSFGDGEKKYYTITGWINDTEKSENTLDFTATYNSKHVFEAGSVTLENLSIVNATGTNARNYNYSFVPGAQLVISGYITQKELDVLWGDTVDDAAIEKQEEGGKVTKLVYAYNSTRHTPFASIDGGAPEGTKIVVSGGQTNSGNDFTAMATLSPEEGAVDVDTRDYKLNNSDIKFNIVSWTIKVTPNNSEVTYDRADHGLSKYKIEYVNGGVVTELANEIAPGSDFTLEGKTYAITMNAVSYENDTKNTAVTSFRNAGTYKLIPNNVQITSGGKNVTDNFVIDNIPGTLTINPQPITVTGIKAKDKTYDGTDVAELDFTGTISFTGLIAGDSLKLDESLITGKFDNKNVGNDKNVTVTIPKNALLNGDGTVAKNYALVCEDGKDYQIQTPNPTASISKNGAVLKPQDITEISYGDAIPFGASIVDTIDDNADDVKVSGQLVFTVTKDGVSKNYTYTIASESNITLADLASNLTAAPFADMKLDAGNYTISLDVSNLSSGDYQFSCTQTATLKVNKKALTTVGIVVGGTDLKKEYDGTVKVPSEQKTEIMSNQSSYFTFTGLEDGDSLSLKSFTASYNDKNVKTDDFSGAQYVVLTDLVLVDSNVNYALDASLTAINIPAQILPKAITLKAKDITGITYGDAKTLVEAKYGIALAEGSELVDGETLTGNVYDTISYSTPYNPEEVANRGAGTYVITPSITSYKNANYAVTLQDGQLTVGKKTVKVGVKKDGSTDVVLDVSGNFTMGYGNKINGDWFLPSYTGFVYGESESSDSLNISDSIVKYRIDEDKTKYNEAGYFLIERGNADHETKIAGDYILKPQVDTLNDGRYPNYTFEPDNSCRLLVNKKVIQLRSSGVVSIVERMYDATTKVYVEQIRLGENADVELTNDGVNHSAASFDYAYLNSGELTSSDIIKRDLDWLKEHKDTGIKFNLESSGTHYDTKDTDYTLAGDSASGKPVNLSFTLSEYLSQSYELNTSTQQKTAESHITRKPIKITAKVDPNEIKYGTVTTSFSNKADSFAGEDTYTCLTTSDAMPSIVPGGFTGNTINGTNGQKWITGFKHDNQSEYSHKDDYDVYPYGFKEGNNGNYIVSYEKCTLKVIPAQLEAPEVTWSAENPGHVSFKSVSGIGNVTVNNYEMKLFKVGDGDTDTEIPLPDTITADNVLPATQYELLETIRESGVGSYYVTVKAYASTVNNLEKINVIDSDAGKSEAIHAVNVIVQMDDAASTDTAEAVAKAVTHADGDAITLSHSEDNASVTSASSNVTKIIVQGEKDIAFGMTSNGNIATGYKVSSIAVTGTDAAKISFGSDSGSQSLDSSTKTRSYSNTYNVGNLTSSDDIYLKVKLEKEKVTISAKLSFDRRIDETITTGLSDKIMYGYTTPPKMKVNLSVVSGDTVSTSDYTYTYEWIVRKKGGSSTEVKMTGGEQTDDGAHSIMTFPTKGSYTSIGACGEYYVYCNITATRKDNGASQTYNTKDKLGLTDGRFTIVVESAPLNISAAITPNSWMYGSTRGAMSYSGRPDDCSVEPVYFFNTTTNVEGVWSSTAGPNGWSRKMITDANSAADSKYYMVAYFAPSANYGECVTTPVEYTISKNTFGQPSGMELCLTNEGDKTYGQLDWNGVASIYENAKSAVDNDNCHSVAVPKYDVLVEYSSDGSSYSQKANYTGISSTTKDLSDLLNAKGSYKVSVTAVPDASDDKAVRNVNAGTPLTQTFVVGGINTPGATSKVYDGHGVELEADFPSLSGSESYVWYRDNNGTVTNVTTAEPSIITDGGKKCSPLFVGQSGNYYCVVTDGGNSYVTVKKTVNISKREITLTTATDSKKYDATALTNAGYTFGNVAATDTATVTVNGTITNYAESGADNTYDSSTIVITHSGVDTNVFSENYTLPASNITLGKLTINKRELSISAASDNKTYDGKPLTKNAVDESTIGGDGLVTGQKITSWTVAGSQTQAGSSDNVLSAIVIKSSDSLDAVEVTGNYAITFNKGTLSVNGKSLGTDYSYGGNITVADISDKTYDGKEHKPSVVVKYTDAGNSVDLTLTQGVDYTLEYENNVIPGDNTATVIISGTGNYSGKIKKNFTIKKRAITVLSETASKEYDGLPLKSSGVGALNVTSGTLAEGENIKSVNFTGTITDYVSGGVTNTFDTVKIENAVGTDVTGYYDITLDVGTLTINQKVVTLTWGHDSLASWDEAFASGYTGAVRSVTASVSNKVTVDGVVDDVSVATYVDDLSDSANKKANQATNVGNYTAIAESLSGTRAFNYTLVGCGNTQRTWSIGKKDRTISVGNINDTYDGTPKTVSPTADDNVGDNAVTLEVSYESLTDSVPLVNVGTAEAPQYVPVYAGKYKATIKAPATGNYKEKIVTATIEINPRNLTVTSDSKDGLSSWIYDGQEHTLHSVTTPDIAVDSTNSLASGDSILTVNYTGKITDVVYDAAGSVTTQDNTFDTVKITRTVGGTSVDVTFCYVIECVYGKLQVNPRELVADDLNLSANDFDYTGSLVGPVVTVSVDLLSNGTRKTLIKGSDNDYVITDSLADKKIDKATDVGTYTVEVTGKGNYKGTVSKPYTITNNTVSSIKDGKSNTLENGQTYKYCKEFKLNVSNPNLSSVVIKSIGTGEGGADETIVSEMSIQDGTYTYTLYGQGDDKDVPVQYEIEVKDVKSIDASGVETYNTQTVKVDLYPDHNFGTIADYTGPVADKSPVDRVYESNCKHVCGAKDYIVKPEGTVKWDYNYHYTIPDHAPQYGTQNVGERETYAIVELKRNGTVIASKIVNCQSQCGVGGSGSATGNANYSFDSYDPADPSKDSGTAKLDLYAEDGTPYSYTIEVSAVHLDAAVYQKTTAYSVTYDAANEKIPGDHAVVTYTPTSFMVPWEITLKNLPLDENGDEIRPTALYVKVLYANSADSTDAEYNVISQDVGVGIKTDPTTPDGAHYSGYYPCWKFIGGATSGTKTYYHRVQVFGYDYDGQFYSVADQGLRSICDADHVNHTITYDHEADSATGVILYELSNLFPQLIFDSNMGSNEVYKVIWKGMAGGEVSAEEFDAVQAPSRPGYTFLGWFDAAVGGDKVTGPVTLGDALSGGAGKIVYAHWQKNPDPKKDDEPSGGENTTPETPVLPIPDKPVIPELDQPGLPINNSTPGVQVIENKKPHKSLPGVKTEVIAGTPLSEIAHEKPIAGNIRVFLENNKTILGQLSAKLNDTQKVLDVIMNDDISRAIDSGESVEVRVTVDPITPDNVPNAEKDLIGSRIDKLKAALKGMTFGRYISVKLDWRVVGKDWNNIPYTDEPITITIDIPKDLIGDSRIYYLSRANGDFEELMKDMDEVDSTITFATSDFEGTYAILYCEPSKGTCFWHWLLLLSFIITLLFLILVKIQKDEEDELESQNTSDSLEEAEKRRKRNSKIRLVCFTLGTVVSIIFAILGHCEYDWPVAIIQIIVTGSAETYKEVKTKDQRK